MIEVSKQILEAEQILGFEMTPVQRLWFAQLRTGGNREELVSYNRQSGKTTFLHIYATVYAMQHPGSNIFIGAPTFRMARNGFLGSNVRANVRTSTTITTKECKTVFNNNSIIWSWPLTRSDTICPPRPSLVLIDEAQVLASEIEKEFVLSMINIYGSYHKMYDFSERMTK